MEGFESEDEFLRRFHKAARLEIYDAISDYNRKMREFLVFCSGRIASLNAFALFAERTNNETMATGNPRSSA